MKKILLTILTTSLLTGLNCYAGGNNESPNIGYEHYTKVMANFQTGTFDPYSVPFDVPFIIYGPIDSEILKVKVYYWEHCENCEKSADKITIKDLKFYQDDQGKCLKKCDDDYGKLKNSREKRECQKECYSKFNKIHTVEWERSLFTRSKNGNDTFYIIVEPLDPIKKYDFVFDFTRKISRAEQGALNTFLRPFIKKFANAFYSAHYNFGVGNDKDINSQLINIYNPQIEELYHDLSAMVLNYFKTKNIPLTQEDIDKNYKDDLIIYLNKRFLIAMTNKRDAYKNLEGELDKGKKIRDKILALSLTDSLTFNSSYKKLKLPEEHYRTIKKLIDKSELNLLISAKKDISDGSILMQRKDSRDIGKHLQYTIDNKDKLIRLINYFKDSSENIKHFLNISNTLYNSDLKTYEDLAGYLAGLQYYISEYAETTTVLEQLIDSDPSFDFSMELGIPAGLEGRTTASFVTRGEWYITADLGVAHTWLKENRAVVPYLGANFNFSPINRQANYSLFKFFKSGDFKNIRRSMSGVIGISVVEISDFNNNYTDSWGKSNISLVTGTGIRLTDGVRLSYGLLWAYRNNNELSATKDLTVNNYIALSLDWDLRQFISNIAAKFPAFK